MARVTEALKPRGSVATGAMIRLGAVGGRVTFADREFLADGPHFQLVAGESYLIFLVFHEQLGMFVNSEFDVFNVDGPQARRPEDERRKRPMVSSSWENV